MYASLHSLSMPSCIIRYCIVPPMKPHELIAELVRRAGGSLPVAKAMRAPTFQGTLNRICNGRIESPSRVTAERIARHFDIPIDAIYDERVAARVAKERLNLDVQMPPPPDPPADFRDRRDVSDSDWALLEDVKLVLDKDELARIHERAEMLRRHARDWWESNIAAPAAAKTAAAPGEAKVPSPLRPSQAKPAAAKKGAAR